MKTTTQRMTHPLIIAAFAVAVLGLALAGCSDSDDVAGPANDASLVLADADAKVDGVSLVGRTIHVGQQADGHVRYEAHLVDADHAPAPGHAVRVDFAIPGMGMGMMTREGSFMLHDDGTHGDPLAGDGIYCYVDSSAAFGCHGAGARTGEYRYEFCGLGADGRESNRIGVNVILAP